MTQSELKELKAIGAELGAAKAENEKLRELLREVRSYFKNMPVGMAGRIDAALSQQDESECRCTMRERTVGDGCSVCNPELAAELEGDEPAPAQDEQSPEQMLSREQIENIARKVHGDCIRLPGATYQHAAEAAVMYTLERIARPAQTAPQGKLAIGDRVRKTSGSEWQGRICGTYSTTLTPEGYAVESEAHAGSVQIYPAKALEAVE